MSKSKLILIVAIIVFSLASCSSLGPEYRGIELEEGMSQKNIFDIKGNGFFEEYLFVCSGRI